MRSAVLSRKAFQTRKPPRAGRPAWKVAEDYKRWLRKLPCARCEHTGGIFNPIVAAHVDIAGGKGTSTKVADRHCIPLCNDCHIQQTDVLGWPNFEKLLPLGDAVALASVYWTEWPGRVAWEREQREAGVVAR